MKRSGGALFSLLASAFFWLMAAGGAYGQETAKESRQRTAPAASNPVVANAAYEQLLLDADASIKNGKPGEAYALLEPLEFVHAGEERFDYLLGIAALDSGKPDKATFALERVLLVNPDSAAARMDMARAYYQLGDMPRARTEFLAVSKLNISDAARVTVEKYLDEIAVRESGGQTLLSGYIEGAYGRDSNINASTSQSQITVDAVTTGPVTLDPVNVATPDNYLGAAAGAEIRHSLNGNWGVYAGGDWRRRDYDTHKRFDALDTGTRAGMTYGENAERFSAGILNVRNNLGGQHNYDVSGWNGEWRHAFSPANQSNAFVQEVKYRYADIAMQPNDFDRRTLGMGWLHATVDGGSTLSGALYRGTETAVSSIITTTPVGSYTGRADGDKQYSGLRIGGQTALGGRTTLFANAGVQDGHYDKTNRLFLRQRSDRLYDVTAGANWSFAKLWVLRSQINYTKNDSNIEIYSYQRKDVSLTVRRVFR